MTRNTRSLPGRRRSARSCRLSFISPMATRNTRGTAQQDVRQQAPAGNHADVARAIAPTRIKVAAATPTATTRITAGRTRCLRSLD